MLDFVIKPVSLLSEDERIEAGQVGRLAFAGQPHEDLDWCGPEWLVLGRLDGRIVSRIGLLRREILVGEQVLAVGGVGGVSTHPDVQRRGFAGQALQRAAQFMRADLQVPFGLLVCSAERVPYYSKFGWQMVTAPMYFAFRGEKRLFVEPVMVLPLVDQPWPQGSIDLQGGPW